MSFTKVAQTSELSSGSMEKVVLSNHEILVANISGTFYAIAERCPHGKGHLSKGPLQDCIVTCPNHGSQFDMRTGQGVKGPRSLFGKATPQDTLSYPVKIEGDTILIGMD